MASEPKKPIERMLEALAKARRAEFGDAPKMPNPMRARLHEEIARAGATEDEKVEPQRSWLTMFWPRLTVAAALATLIVLVPAIWWNQSHPVAESGDLALRGRSAGAADGFNAPVAAHDTLAKAPAVSATEPTVNLADNSQIKVEPAARPASIDKEIAAAKIQAAPAAAPAIGRDSKAEPSEMAAAAPPVAQASINQEFSQQSSIQSFRNNAQVNRAANILNTFQVQQHGNDIRVLDSDGSTYTGKIEQSAKSAELDSHVTARRDAAKQMRGYAAETTRGSGSAAAQSYFRATGFNVSLKKTLVFEGNYAAPTTQQAAMSGSNDTERAEQSHERARIVGTVLVNGEAPVEVDAIAETPEPAATKKSEK